MLTIEARRDAVVRGLAERVTLHGVTASTTRSRARRRRSSSRAFTRRTARSGSPTTRTARSSTTPSAGCRSSRRCSATRRRIVELTEELRQGFDHVVVLGMGGSSLCSEVVRRVFGKREGYPELLVLDSTVPEAVRMLEARIDVAKTLFIVASKSGTTTEPMMFHRYFYDRVKSVKGERAGENFIAVTDPDTQLVAGRAARQVPADLRQSRRHRRALLRAVVLRPRADGADRRRHRRRCSIARCTPCTSRICRRCARTRPRSSARPSARWRCRAATS